MSYFADNENLNVNSIHRFSWLFSYDDCKPALADYIIGNGSVYSKNSKWQKVDLSLADVAPSTQEFRDLFMLNQYLSKPSEMIFLSSSKPIFQLFEYRIEKDAIYEIKKHLSIRNGNEIEEKELDYKLPIVRIELQLYDILHIGILTFHIVNREYKDITDIKRINDYGRRIQLPFIPANMEALDTSICADSLAVKVDDVEYTTDFRGQIKQLFETPVAMKMQGSATNAKQKVTAANMRQKMAAGKQDQKDCGLDTIAGESTIMKQLILGKEGSTAWMEHQKHLVSGVDDRMYVACLIRNDCLSKQVTEDESEESRDLLYSIVHMDRESSTCQDSRLRDANLEKNCYYRWARYGTLYGATEFSFVCITGESETINESTVRPFVVEYPFLCSLVQVQRAAIMKFEDLAGKQINGAKTKEFMRLQMAYSEFKKIYQISECSTQEQGRDVYHLLQENAYIEEEQAILDAQMRELFDIKSTRVDLSIARYGVVISVLLAVLPFISELPLNAKIITIPLVAVCSVGGLLYSEGKK